MSRLTRDGTAEPVSRDQILRHARGQGNVHFPCSADHEQDWQPYPVDPYSAIICDDYTYIHTYDIRAFGITGDWETMAVNAEVWVEAVTEGGRRFMAAWRQEEEDAARHRQEKREATRLGKLQSHTEA